MNLPKYFTINNATQLRNCDNFNDFKNMQYSTNTLPIFNYNASNS